MMTRIYASICAFAIAISLQSPAYGQFIEIEDEDIYSSTAASRIGLTGFGFLKISQGARSAGMGDAYTAISNDINAAFKNPAGLDPYETDRVRVLLQPMVGKQHGCLRCCCGEYAVWRGGRHLYRFLP